MPQDLSQWTDEELQAAKQRLIAEQPPEPVDVGKPLDVFYETGLRGVADNLLNSGPATGETAAQGAALLRSIGPGFSEEFDPKLEEERGKFPANLLSVLKPPENLGTTFDIQAQVQSLFGPGSFEENRDTIVEEFLRRREAAPTQSMFGDVGADVGSLLATRTPFQRGLRNRAAQKTPDLFFGDAAKLPSRNFTPAFFEGARNLGKQSLDKVLPLLKRGGIRVGETGLEGALVAAMNDDDPLTTAVMAAGAQTIGGTALAMSKGLLGNKGGNMAMAAAGYLAWLQTFKEATPGGRDRILESSETAFAKLSALMVTAGLAGSVGLGRVGGNMRTQTPEFADMFTTVPRGAMLSWLKNAADDDSGENELVLKQILKDAETGSSYFGPTAQRRFERALTVPGAPDLNKQIELLKSDRRFKRRLNALREPSEVEKLMEGTPTHQIERN